MSCFRCFGRKKDANKKKKSRNLNNEHEEGCYVESYSPVYDYDDDRTKPIIYTSPKICPAESLFVKDHHSEEEDDAFTGAHKNVVSHLLSQVRIGMDLSRITLPTHILEKRSLLEMYADFFAHADYFVQIAQENTPEKRFIACLRFYFSAIAAGRKGSSPKKPYNPVLGEVFRCYYDDPSLPIVTDPPVIVHNGPLQWSKTNHVAFIAEQVSHHPPISAFYAEHKDLGIQFNGHIWTKSKFLGLSVAVHNEGQGSVKVLDYNEEYVFTFPTGYGRSILTTPWIEMGGDCTIICDKTEYTAHVKFHTKPAFGGKPHRVTGNVVHAKEKPPFCTFEGEWNATINCKYSNGTHEHLIDASKPKLGKYVQRISLQGHKESRRLWEKVTMHLGAGELEEATAAKQEIEEHQRHEAKTRAERQSLHKSKYFYLNKVHNWVFEASLEER